MQETVPIWQSFDTFRHSIVHCHIHSQYIIPCFILTRFTFNSVNGNIAS